jgi:beta-lactamase regulating signal transducer with metallopeptidase domain/tetratricopeptide (TPR) repeat protein
MSPLIDFATRLQSLEIIIPVIVLIVKATLILAIARLLLVALPKATAASKHVVVTAALLGVLALPLLTVAVPSWSLGLLPQPADPSERIKGIGSTGDDQESPTALSTALTVAKAAGVVPQEPITRVKAAVDAVRNSWQGMILLALAGVSGLLLFRMALGIAGVGVVARRSAEVTDDAALMELDRACDHLQLGRPVRLLRSDGISVPVVWGFLNPILLLPAKSAEWSRERLRVVLLHELAHVKRGDGITLLFTRAAVALFWFHPMAWSLERLGRAECERACDDLVLATGTKPSEYAEHLLSIARALPHVDPFRSVTLAMSRRSQLEGRLLSILEPKAQRGSSSMRAISMVVTASLFVLIPLATVRLVAAPDEKKREREGIVEIGPSVAARIAETPEMMLAQFEKIKNKRKSYDETPDSAAEWYSRGSELHGDDRYPEAIAAFKKSYEQGYRQDASAYNAACGYSLSGDTNNALIWLEKAIEAGFDDADHFASDSDLDPLRGDSRYQALVKTLPNADEVEDDRYSEAMEKYRALVDNRSQDGDEWFDVGNDLLRLRKFDETIDAYKQAIRLNHKNSSVMYNMACAYSLRGDVNSAIEWLQRAVEQGWDDADHMQNDSDLTNARRDRRFEDIVDLADELRLHTGWQGKIWFFGQDRDREAWANEIARYQELTRKYPTMGRTWFNLGYAQLQAGDNLGSVQSFRKAVELGYRTPTSMYNTACAYARAGQKDAAFEWLQKARAAGFDLKNYLNDDDDLSGLRSDPRFTELRRQVRRDRQEKKHDDDGEIF